MGYCLSGRFPSPELPGSGSKGFSQLNRTPSVGASYALRVRKATHFSSDRIGLMNVCACLRGAAVHIIGTQLKCAQLAPADLYIEGFTRMGDRFTL